MAEISKRYNHNEVEDKIYKLWEKSGFFSPDNLKDTKGRYCNVLPPPNANGELHLGHASGYTVMDIFGRYHRMRGEKTLLLPGKDHAGILTQVVYERKLKEEKNITRQELGREKFYQEVYDFCIDRANYMRAQEKRIGLGADWSREKFTLDPDVLKIALETFVKMYEDGMIYRGERIINWCPRCGTALSDLEVVYKKTKGKLYWIKYGPFILATARPETKLGDTAVAVNPKDDRYKDMVGKKFMIPGVLGEFEITVVADEAADPEFGTGVIKVTPAHDFTDFEIAKRHNLPMKQIIDEQGRMMKNTGKYAGMTTAEAREAIVKDMEKMGLIDHIDEDYEHSLATCERCGTIIEPIPSEQWFVNVDAKKYSIKKECLKAIKEGKINIYPDSFKNILLQWFENLRDWCISRQIWWGPRIPVWYKTSPQPSPYKGEGERKPSPLQGEGAQRADEVYVGIEPPKGEGWTQDPDTFDTWFTSGQWAYSTLGYPNGEDAKQFYPTDMMVMGRDILFFWSARMILMSLYRTGEVPFRNLYFTGLIRDKEGHKMSKSRGNGIDPLEMIDKYSADALRMSLVTDNTPGLDTRLYEEKIERYRNFVTKLWNIYRYSNSNSDFSLVEKIDSKNVKTLSDRWMVSRLNETIGQATKMMEEKKLALAENFLINFTWNELADWYIEIHKLEKNNDVLGYVFDKILKLWHPFMPFVTEKIFQDMRSGEKILMVEKWPEADKNLIDKKVQKEFSDLQEIITKIRTLRASYHIAPAQIINAFGKIGNYEIIEKLARIKIIKGKAENKSIKINGLSLDIAELIDVKKEIASLEKEAEILERSIDKNKKLLDNSKFLAGASEEVKKDNKERLEKYEEKLTQQKELLENLKQL